MDFLYLLLLVVIALVLQRLSLLRGGDKLGYELELDRQAVECDEQFTMRTCVMNDSRLPVLFLRVTENVPAAIQLLRAAPGVKLVREESSSYTGRAQLEQSVYIMPRQRIVRETAVSLPARGKYIFWGACLHLGDLLGLSERDVSFGCCKEVVVYPRAIRSPELDLALGSYLGELSVRRFILEDPILTLGFREYTGREPQHDISWPKSLSQNRLMVKQYDHTSEPTAAVILNISGGSPEAIERCFSLARGVCESLEARRVSYSFLTNAAAASVSGLWSFLADGSGSQHLFAILEGLGRASYAPLFGFELLMGSAMRHADANRAYVLVTPELDVSALAALRRFEARTGSRILVVNSDNAGQEAVG